MAESSSSDLESAEINEVIYNSNENSSHSVVKIKLQKNSGGKKICHNFTPADKSMNRLNIKYHKINAKIGTYKNLSQLSIKNSFNENDENIEKKIFSNAEKKVFKNSNSSLYPRNADHYILDRPKKYFNIHENITINNLMYNNLLGEITFQRENAFYKRYLAIKNNNMLIYNYIIKPDDKEKYDVLCEKDNNFIYRAEKIINLKKSEIYISSYKNINMYNFLSYFFKQNQKAEQINITNKQIVQIIKSKNIFTIKLKEKADQSEFQTSILEFSLLSNNLLFTFRPKNISDFLRWTFAIYNRKK